MSQLYVDNIRNRTGGPIGIPTGAVVTGVVTATTGNITGNQTVGGNLTVTGNAEVGGVLTYEDVTNIDSVGVVTARSGIEFGASGVGGTITATGQAEFVGFVLHLVLLEMELVLLVLHQQTISSLAQLLPLLISIQPVLLLLTLLRATSYWTPTFLTK